MSSEHGDRGLLRLVAKDGCVGDNVKPIDRDLDWSILMARAQDGDGAAYHRLLQEITPYLRSLAVRRHRDPNDIEDAVQDTLLSLHAVRQTYDPARPFAPWLVAIAERRFIDQFRKQGRRRDRETLLQPEHDAFVDINSNQAERRLERRDLEKAIGDLPPAQQQAIRLLKINELSLNEASAATGASVTSLKVNVHRALRSLRKLLIDRSDI